MEEEAGSHLREEIFGSDGSDSSPSVDEQEASQDEEVFESKEEIKPERQEEDKIMEARREFDEALEKIKSTGNRRSRKAFDTGEPVDLDDIAERFAKRMMKAVEMDNEAVEAGKPALTKLKMLNEVVDMLTKRHFHEVLLDNDVLVSIRAWLEPMPNRTLPSPNIRKALLESLRNLPIETVHLRESGLGKIVNFFSQRPGELEDIRRLSNELIATWSRPILARGHSLSDTYDRKGLTIKSESLKKAPSPMQPNRNASQRKIVQHLTAKKRSKK